MLIIVDKYQDINQPVQNVASGFHTGILAKALPINILLLLLCIISGCGHLATRGEISRLYPKVKRVCIFISAKEIPQHLRKPDDIQGMFSAVAQPLRAAGYTCLGPVVKMDQKGWPICPAGADALLTIMIGWKTDYGIHANSRNRLVADSCTVFVKPNATLCLGRKLAWVWQKGGSGAMVRMEHLSPEQKAALEKLKKATPYEEARRPPNANWASEGIAWGVLDRFTQPWVSTHFILDAQYLQALASSLAVKSALPKAMHRLGAAVVEELKNP